MSHCERTVTTVGDLSKVPELTISIETFSRVERSDGLRYTQSAPGLWWCEDSRATFDTEELRVYAAESGQFFKPVIKYALAREGDL